MSSVGFIQSEGIKTFLIPVQRDCGICGRNYLCRWYDMEFKQPLCKECAISDVWVDALLNSLEGYRRPGKHDTPKNR
jgi:hypothetical protein